MTYTVHDALVPPLTRGLNSLSGLLTKAEASAEARGFDPAVLLTARLAPNMFPLTRQVQIATDTVKNGAGRLAGIEVPSWPDTESSFAELHQRVRIAVDYLGTVRPEQLEGAEDRTITLPLPSGPIQMPGRMFLSGFVLPNFYFHVTTAYAILRHNGVELGKMDYLGPPQPQS